MYGADTATDTCLERKTAIAEIEQILQGRPKQVDHHNIVVTFDAVPEHCIASCVMSVSHLPQKSTKKTAQITEKFTFRQSDSTLEISQHFGLI